ncbi:MAG: hypothetical protein FH753_12340 [Firmicutes bacterium]|nr:hypothetical protein [Bacillota bacterium]
MWGLGSIFYFVFMGIVILLILLLTILSINKKILKYEIIVFIPLIIFSSFYFFNQEFQLDIKSYLSPNKEHTVFYNNEKLKIKLPDKTVWLFKTPTDVYYSKYSVKYCKKYFENNLNNLKKAKKISNYTYNNKESCYIVTIKPKIIFKINFIENPDARRFSITEIYEK